MSHCYEIRVVGHLGRMLASRLDGMSLCHRLSKDRPITVISGPVADQSALYGIIGQLRDLGIELISVQPLDDGDRKGACHA